jgi:predicted acylesterase/phospholipase RssA
VRDSRLLKLTNASFERVVARNPAVVMALTRQIVTRYQRALAATGGRQAGALSTLAIVSLANDGRVAEFARRLTDALTTDGSVLYLDAERIDQEFGEGASRAPVSHARDDEIGDWLNAQESNYRFIVYKADPVYDAWTRRCIRQADRLLLVADVAESPGTTAVEMAMLRDGAASARLRTDLVLLHPRREPLFSGTGAWLADRRVDRHHHVVMDDERDVHRLARLLTGRATGVILGGGGARCFAQIGVLRAMEEAGIAIDMIGGTSMGAFLSAQYAMGWDTATMQEKNRDIWVRYRPLKDYTFPYLGLITGRRFTKMARDIYGAGQLEDLPIPFFCCSSNLTRAEVMIHERGPIWRALAASIAVPGLAPPAFEGGSLLVDGAVLANLPIDVARSRCDGTLIAIDVSPLEDLACDPAIHDPPSAWGLAFRQTFRRRQGPSVPSILDLLSRASSLASVQQVDKLKAQADLYLHPPTEPYSMFDFDRIDDMVDCGYRYAAEALAGWRADAGDGAERLTATEPERPSRGQGRPRPVPG